MSVYNQRSVKHFEKTVSDYPHFIFNLLTYMGVSRTKIKYLSMSGKYTTEITNGIQWGIYAFFHVNSWLKGLFLLGFFTGFWQHLKFKAFDDIQFFDNIAALLWFIIFMEICTADWILMRRCPFYETLTAGWKVQNEIHEKLGPKAKEFKKQQDSSAVKKVWFQWIVILMGICSCIIQYASAPKYCIFTNSLIENDSVLINWLMGIHDVGFIVHAWMNYGVDIAIQSVFGGQLQHCLRFLTEELKTLTENLKQKNDDEKHLEFRNHHSGSSKRSVHIESSSTKKLSPRNILRKEHVHFEPKHPNDISSEYTIDLLIMDYKKLFIYVDRMNANCCNNFLFMHVISYVQMTCDVFVVFQLLRTPGSTFTDVFYFIEDCMVCMYLLFKCFKAIGFVGDTSEQFLLSFQLYMTKGDPHVMLHKRIHNSLQKIGMKLGPNSCGPWTVGNAIMILLNYYIMVALWPET